MVRMCKKSAITKGQLISDAIFLGLQSPKKQMNFIIISFLASKVGQIKKNQGTLLYQIPVITNSYRKVP